MAPAKLSVVASMFAVALCVASCSGGRADRAATCDAPTARATGVRQTPGTVVPNATATASCDRAATGPGYHLTELPAPGLPATLNQPRSIAVDGAGNIFIADAGNCTIWRVAPGGDVTISVGTGSRLPPDNVCNSAGDGGPPTQATLDDPLGVAIGADGTLYVADSFGGGVRKVSNGVIATVARCNPCDSRRGPPTDNNPRFPTDVALDTRGNLYISDECRVLRLAGGQLDAVAGTGSCSVNVVANGSGFVPTAIPAGGVAATGLDLNYLFAIAAGPSGDLYISDDRECIVWLLRAGKLLTAAGTGRQNSQFDCEASGGDGASAQRANVSPSSITVDDQGNLFINDAGCRVRVVDTAGVIWTAETGVCGALASDRNGRVYILDAASKRLYVLER